MLNEQFIVTQNHLSRCFFSGVRSLGLHALFLYMNADVGLVFVLSISVLIVSTWFLSVFTISLMVRIYN